MKTELEQLIETWEKDLKELNEELDKLIEDEDYDDHDADNLQGHIERLESDLLAVKRLKLVTEGKLL
jgi:protein-arginine kinase activator protein McsA